MEPPGKDGLLQDASVAVIGDALKWMRESSGPKGERKIFRARLVGMRCVGVSGYELCREALIKQEFQGKDAYAELFRGILGETTLLTMDDWGGSLSATKSIIHTAILDSMDEIVFNLFVTHLDQALDAAGSKQVNLYELVRDAVQQTLVEQVIGVHHMDEREEFVKLLKDHFRAVSKPPIALELGPFIKTGFKRGIDARDRLVQRFAATVEKFKPTDGKYCPAECPSLLCRMFLANFERGERGESMLSNEVLAGALLVLSNAVIPKTVATLVATTAACITRDPKLMRQVRSEAAGGGQRPLSELVNDTEALEALRLSLKETGRLWPALVVAPRKCASNAEFGGYRVMAGRYVLILLLMANRDAAVYGDDAEKFSVERWRSASPPPEPLTFGGGKRECSGRPLAERFALVALARLAQRYSVWQLPPGAKSDDFKWLPVAAHKSPLAFVLRA